MPCNDRKGFIQPVEQIPEIHYTVDPVAVVDLSGILRRTEVEGFGRVEDHEGKRCFGEDLCGFQRGGIGGVPCDDRFGAFFFEG